MPRPADTSPSSTPTASATTTMTGERRRLAYLGVLLGVFMIVLDTTIVNVAVPRIQHDLYGTVTAAQWVVNSYNLTFAALLLTAGAAADRLGGRRVFTLGLAGFAVASLACGAAPILPVLVAARLVQGASAALMLPTALSLAAHLHPDPAARARAFGQWAAVAGAATVLGPLAGGLLVDSLGWRAIFVINFPVAAIAWLLLARNTPETSRRRHPLDLGGQALSLVMLAAAAIGLTEAGRRGWTNPTVLIGLATALVAAAGLVVLERRLSYPMIPPHLIARRQFAATSIVGLILSIGIYGQLFVLSLYFQNARGDTATDTGLALLPFAAVTVAGPLLAGRLLARNLIRGTLLAGQLAGAAGSLLLATITPHAPYPLIAAGLLLLGLCQSASQPAVASAALITTPPEQAGIASGVLTATRQVGSVLGVALLGGLISHSHNTTPGMHTALLIVTTLFAIGAVLTAVLIRSRHTPTIPQADTTDRD